ncbi:ferredoxin [Metallumcola ferriviriculae]|uniref:Ferredoxin n=1 Tax=Metallumcola ferriviriculae TaxID=3039180 RepID=A0AAU0UKM6_9FIRM|nr:ferredoxin [Desulfitibacteraceae bacterium MK1]
MKVKINEELCIACGACEGICPDVFKLEGDVSKVLVDEIPPEFEDEVIEAAEGCPSQAIEVEK